ncbi:hypothetical protein LRS06_05545 [Hymenobacter sp. J193]|uniref:hypothetical protein n=1 Tax=Hymenobacter sp. J193 TaxID=2898429 RepID=UPI0021510FC6|nr:hypothetical protein [Hymenobacter sp. J193]MCR5887250.1 hypothetical protein [Hymenobacter sp. J193]
MKTFRHYLVLFALLLTVAACKKDKDNEPSKTALLTAKAWKDDTQTLRLNTSEGTYKPSASSVSYYQFGADGKVTMGLNSGGATSTGTWAFAKEETQLAITSQGKTTTFELFELTDNRLSFGFNYDQAQIQAALNNQNNSSQLTLLLLSAGSFTFAGGTPNIPAAQLTSVQWKTNLIPR